MPATIDRAPEAAAGERGEFAEWVDRLVPSHTGRLLRVVRREGVRAEDALDCVQDAFHTFLRLPQARQTIESDDDAVKLLTVLARNHARNRRRKHETARRHESSDEMLDRLPAEAVPVDERIAREESLDLISGCLDHLGTLQREVVSLRMLDEVAGKDVAASLGLPPEHVAVLLHRAKRNLRSCMVSAGYRP